MQTVTIDILNSKAMQLLKDLEILQLIRLRKSNSENKIIIDWSKKYKGAMAKQPIADIDAQLNELRNEWE
jgi:hypothetical protein